jgi:hypothetical protein
VVEINGKTVPQTTLPGTATCLDLGLSECPDQGCVDLDSNVKSCGDCGHSCAEGEACEGGNCVGGCSAAKQNCSGECVDLSTSVLNCGACGHTCAELNMISCVSGTCQGCVAGSTSCNGKCIDLLTSAENCGACGVTCAAGQECVGGTCQGCVAGQTLCNGQCVDTLSSPENCGACGNTCSSGQQCVAGTCTGGGNGQTCAAGIHSGAYTCDNGCGCQHETVSCNNNQEANFTGDCQFNCQFSDPVANCGTNNTVHGHPNQMCIFFNNPDGSLLLQCNDQSGNFCQETCQHN